ncbi:GNAT family N-acetyltransferase [Sphingomonas lacunae]|nr:GNAT family N-acetyltransferase [Sphingomonas lacunae]
MTMVADFSVAEPVLADAEALSAMAQASFCDTFAYRNYPADDLAGFLATAMGPERYAAQIADPAYGLRIVRNLSNEIIGFIKMGPNDLPLVDGDQNDAVRELHQLYLLPAAKGTGMADFLMNWGVEWARAEGARSLYLSVYFENIRAQKFYARHGFVEIGKNPFWVGQTCDDDRVWRRPL